MFRTANHHLRVGGLFVFDCWYGPAVLSDPPVVRVRRIDEPDTSIVRVAEPAMQPRRNVVDVHYQVLVMDRASRVTESIRETHSVRYFFDPELERFARENGFEIVAAREWLRDAEPSFRSWFACYVGRRIEAT